MSISLDPIELGEEIIAAEHRRDERLSVTRSLIDGYTSPYFDKVGSGDDSDDASYNPENFGYGYVTRVLPQVTYNNPRWRCQSRRGGPTDVVADAIRLGLDRWVRDIHLSKKLRPTVVDMCVGYGIGMVVVEDHPTFLVGDSPARWPQFKRISPFQHFRDPLALSIEECRYFGHQWIVDKEDLLEFAKGEEGWDVKAIKGIPETSTDDLIHGRTDTNLPDRNQVVCYDLWIRDDSVDGFEPEDGFHGRLVSLAQDGWDSSQFVRIREDRPYYGPKEGPYEILGAHPVTDDPYHLAPLVAIEGQNRSLNRMARAVDDGAARYKRLILVNNTDPAFVEQVRDGEHDLVIQVAGIDKNTVIPVEIGGINDQNLVALELAKGRAERNLGIGDVARGVSQGSNTATEAALADESTDIREDYIKQQVYDFVQGIGYRAAWYLYHDDEIVFPLGHGESLAMGAAPGELLMFQGGEHDDDMGATFDDLELDIEPMSMARASEGLEQRRGMELFQLIVSAAPVIAQTPYIKWDDFLESLGERFNMPDLGDLVDTDMAAQMFGLMAGQPEQPKGRLSKESPAGAPTQLSGVQQGGQLGGQVNAEAMSA